jgi:predicted O-methyltransferase YrrM
MGKSTAFMAVEIANSKKYIKFDAIDTWQGSEEHAEMDIIKKDELYNKFLSNIERVKYYINPIRDWSVEASKRYADDSLDFVFIDAAHDYDNVKADINAWYPKVKRGGHIAGHDYSADWPGVRQAVDEYFVGKNVVKSEGSWCYFKN